MFALLLAAAIAKVWSAHPVGFDLLTTNGRQYAAYYDAERRMTLAMRTLGSAEWKTAVLPSTLGWDSHNAVVIAADRDGYLHVSGNMHGHPLVYFRGTKPYEIDGMEPVHRMTGERERRCTYPVFLEGPKGELIFRYRDGGSGAGDELYNVYDPAARAWKRLLDTPFTDGKGERNAYPYGPVRGPDGWYHLLWIWRETPDCETSHDLSYARSRDLVRWETSAGRPLQLPVTLERSEILDPVPVEGGLVNGGARIGFDSRKRPVITYHKFDERGFTQVYHVRFEEGEWKRYRTSDWEYRWNFRGRGTIPFEIRLNAVRPEGGRLRLEYEHIKYGRGAWLLDEATLKPVKSVPVKTRWPAALDKPESPFPGMQVRWHAGKGDARYVLRWETLGPNRDRARQGPLPEPSELRVYEFR